MKAEEEETAAVQSGMQEEAKAINEHVESARTSAKKRFEALEAQFFSSRRFVEDMVVDKAILALLQRSSKFFEPSTRLLPLLSAPSSTVFATQLGTRIIRMPCWTSLRYKTSIQVDAPGAERRSKRLRH